MLYGLMLFADDAAAPPAGNPYGPLVMMGLIFLLGYFLLMRPRGQEKERRAQIAKVKKNDKIVNAGGIIGTVDSIKEQEDEVVLKGGIRILRSSIVKIVNPDESSKESDK